MTKGKAKIHKAYLNLITILLNEDEIRESFNLMISPTNGLDNNESVLICKINGEDYKWEDPIDPLTVLNDFIDYVSTLRIKEYMAEHKAKEAVESEVLEKN